VFKALNLNTTERYGVNRSLMKSTILSLVKQDRELVQSVEDMGLRLRELYEVVNVKGYTHEQWDVDKLVSFNS